jgi:hypothetical protein
MIKILYSIVHILESYGYYYKMASWNFIRIFSLIYCIEYSLMILYLSCYLKYNFDTSKPLSYINQFGIFGILLFLTKLWYYILIIQDSGILAQEILEIAAYNVYFTVFIILAGSW